MRDGLQALATVVRWAFRAVASIVCLAHLTYAQGLQPQNNQNTTRFYSGGSAITCNGFPDLTPTDLTVSPNGTHCTLSIVPHTCVSQTSCAEGIYPTGNMFYNAAQHIFTANPSAQTADYSALTLHNIAPGVTPAIRSIGFEALTDNTWAGINVGARFRALNGAQGNYAIEVGAGDINMEATVAGKLTFPNFAADKIWLAGLAGGTNFAISQDALNNINVKAGASVPRLTFAPNGRIGLFNDTVPSFDLSMGGTADRTIGMEATASGAGHLLNVAGGGATGTDQIGGKTIIKGGNATGWQTSTVEIQVPLGGAAGGTTVRTPVPVRRWRRDQEIDVGTIGTPTLSSGCGNTAAIVGTSKMGRITLQGSGLGTTCILTFSQAYASDEAFCIAVFDTGTAQIVKATTTLTDVTITVGSTFTTGDKITYLCRGHEAS